MFKRLLLMLATFVMLGASLAGVGAQEATPEATAAQGGDLFDVNWLWQELQSPDGTTVTVDDPALYSLFLSDDGALGLRADCNVGNGSYTLDEDQLTITLGVMTLVFCPEGSLSEDNLAHLEQIVSYSIEDDELLLTLSDGGVMRFLAEPPFTGVLWQWTELQSAEGESTSVGTPENYTLLLGDDGSVSIQADCNQGGGTYARSGSELSFNPIATTLIACPEGSQADLYLSSLGDVTSFMVEDGDLVLTLSDASTLRFTAADEITGVEWQWQEFQSMDGSVITVDAPENYTLLLGDDGAASVRADCNQGSGAYTLEGSQISFGAMVLTRAACPPESLSDAYVQYLADVRSYVVEDGELFLSLQMDGGIMRFAQAAE